MLSYAGIARFRFKGWQNTISAKAPLAFFIINKFHLQGKQNFDKIKGI